MKNSKLLGGVLLIVGTAIGAGMLALPIAAAQLGFLNSTLLLISSWLIMTLSAFLILEVNLWLPMNSNIITMAKTILGRWGKVVAWVSYLLLFYSLLSAYIAGGGDFLHNLLQKVGINLPGQLTALLFTLILGSIVYQGIKTVDYFNRGLMFSKFGILAILVVVLLMFVQPVNLSGGQITGVATSFTVMLTSFGFANIIPSLRTYFDDDHVKLRKAVLIGSLIPLVCYILWDLVIMGVISRDGSAGLIAMLHSGHSTSDLANQLSSNLNLIYITLFVRVFTSICLATSFLGVSLSLSDFLADGLGMRKQGKNNLIIYGATFIPPLLIVLFYPTIFIRALSYAGIICMVLLVALPCIMAWQGRYRSPQFRDLKNRFQLFGGKFVPVGLFVAAIWVIVQGTLQNV